MFCIQQNGSHRFAEFRIGEKKIGSKDH
jgi:hypothetical protein